MRELCAIVTAMAVGLSTVAGVPERAAPPATSRPAVPPGSSVNGTGVPVLPLPVDDAAARAGWTPRSVAWPAAGAAMADVPGPAGGGLPVRLATPAQGKGPERVRVEVLGQAASRRLGITGVLLRLTPHGGAGRVGVELDYSAFRAAAGGDFGARLTARSLPACVLDAAGCPESVPPTAPVSVTANNLRTGRLTVQAEANPDTLVAVVASASGSTGTFGATALAPSARWEVGLSSGEFAWSYPLRLPPVPGPEPELTLAYGSGGVDGRMGSSNNQPSWVGEGFDLSSGYIERAYRTCSKDTGGNAGNQDLCWVSNNAASVFGGVAGELVRDDATGTWRAQDDSGWKVELLTGAANGDNDGEYWRLTSPEGTAFYFGLNRLPGWTSGQPETQSAWTVPVFGNHAGEPCRTGTPATSWCQQAYRWNLDFIVDRHGDVVSYSYQKETNSYGRWNGSPFFGQTTPYVRGGYLARIDYGQRDGTVYSGGPAARVVFTVADRCRTTGSACDPTNQQNWPNWPDVPWDEKCTDCTYFWTPTFWSTKRLAKVTTQVLSGGALRDVDSWSLRQSYPDPYPAAEPWEENNDASRSLWLNGIVHTGLSGGTLALPEVTFEGVSKQNRHNASADFPALYKWRVKAINTETGGRIEVDYSAPQCGGEPYVIPDNNVSRCYPRGELGGDRLDPDVFYKYVVAAVREVDRVGGSPTVGYSYEYVGDAAWHYDDADATPSADRDWNQWRGYQKVRVRGGSPSDGPQTVTEHLFLRGMDNDRTTNGRRDVWVTDSQGGRVEDRAELAGFARETIVYNGSTPSAGTIADPWVSAAVATRVRTGLDPIRAVQVDTAVERQRVPLAGGGTRVTEQRHAFDTLGRPVETSDLGDVATAADDTCTRTTFAASPTRWLTALAARTETVSVACTATPSYPADLVSDERVFYDGSATLGAIPGVGDPTREEALDGGTVARFGYDVHGRVVEAYDSLGNRTTTTYTPAVAGPVTQTAVTNALGHTTTTVLDPAWGQPSAEIDANGRRSDAAYDPLGRATGVWLPGRSRAAGASAHLQFDYLIRTNGPAVTTSRTLQGDGGYSTSYELFDGLLRRRQVQTAAPGRGRIVTDTVYDSRGWTVRTNEPYHNASAPGTALLSTADSAVPGQTMFLYDGVGRPTTEILRGLGVEKWRATSGYGGDRVTLDPEDGATATAGRFDADGQLTELDQYQSGAPSGVYTATRYTYTKAGQLSTVTDPAGNVWRYTYDARGRATQVDDPDTGRTTFTYDTEDRRTSSTDARGRTVAYTYDALGRPAAVHDGSTAGPKLAEWTYDTLGSGLLSGSARYVGGQTYRSDVLGYDAAGRPTGAAVTVPAAEGPLAGRYETTYGYNDADETTTIGLPAAGGLPAETVRYGYDARGQSTTVTGLAPYVSATAYTNLGETAQVTFGAPGAQVWQTFSYDAATRRLLRLRTDKESAAIADLNFTYDAAGNLTRLANTPAGQPADVQCLRHDHLLRLVEAWTATDACAGAPSLSVLGGPAPYWRTYGYDVTGNRTSEVKHAAGGDVTDTYTYPAAGGAQPHAVRSIVHSPGTTDTYGYDATGNTTTRPGQTLTWDTEGLLASVAGTSFVYDADGERLLRRDPTGSTLYLPDGMELRVDKATGVVRGTRYYGHQGRTVAVRTVAGLSWLSGDQHGTAEVAIAADTLAVTQRRFLPFGSPRGGTPAWPGERGFVDGTADPSTGLTHLGARDYDPSTGRFVSADPVVSYDDPQQTNPYSYANNSPDGYSDATGMEPCRGGNCDCLYAGKNCDKAKPAKKHKKKKKAKKPRVRSKEEGGPGPCRTFRCAEEQSKKPKEEGGGGGCKTFRCAEEENKRIYRPKEEGGKGGCKTFRCAEEESKKPAEEGGKGGCRTFRCAEEQSKHPKTPPVPPRPEPEEEHHSFWDEFKPGGKIWSGVKIGLTVASFFGCIACGVGAAVMSGVDAARAASEGDYVGAVIEMAGAVTGGIGSGAAAASRIAAKSALRNIKLSRRPEGPDKLLRQNQARMARTDFERHLAAESRAKQAHSAHAPVMAAEAFKHASDPHH